MTIISNKQVKLFNKILKEFSEEYSLITGTELKIKVKADKIIIFNSEANNVLEKIINCETESLNEMTLFKSHNLDFTKINWEYIHTMYFISQGKSIEQSIVQRCKENRNKTNLPVVRSNTLPIPGESFGKLVGDIANQVAKKLDGQDLSHINPQELLASMMSGNMNVEGINFQEILDNSTANFKDKVETGEIDVNDFTQQAHSLMNKLMIPQPPQID